VKNCKGRIKTDEHSSAIINGNCNHTHESDSRKIQKQIIRAVVKRKAASDITTLPIKLVRCELLSIEDECLQENDLKSLTKAASKRNTFLHANVKVFARKRNGNARKCNAPNYF
jgi:hypothetical protein